MRGEDPQAQLGLQVIEQRAEGELGVIVERGAAARAAGGVVGEDAAEVE